MKKIIVIFSIAFAICILLGSCKNEELSADFIVSGTITDYKPGIIDSIKFTSYDEDFIYGTCKILSNGQFSMKLSTPEGFRVGKTFHSNIVVSDTNAIISGFVGAYGYNGYKIKGFILKTNMTSFVYTYGNEKISNFFFSDRPLTIKGTIRDSTDTYFNSEIYDLSLKKGWNEFVISTDRTQSSSIITYSNNIPSDLKWRFFQVSN